MKEAASGHPQLTRIEMCQQALGQISLLLNYMSTPSASHITNLCAPSQRVGLKEMASRVSVDQGEFQAFLAENKRLMEKYRDLLDKLAQLTRLNQDLDHRLKTAEDKLREYETAFAADVTQSDELLRSARENMERLFDETRKVLGSGV
jgi:predicted  nucleic acid-binding Zn-ribbon protein